MRHQFVVGGTYSGPYGLQLNPFVVVRSSRPYNITLGRDVNGDNQVEFRTPGTVVYGFERFRDRSRPRIGAQGLSGPRGDGEYLQTIDATKLEDGVHFFEVRAFRHRTDGGPAIYRSFKKAVLVDRD